jgi:hypothetical protein
MARRYHALVEDSARVGAGAAPRDRPRRGAARDIASSPPVILPRYRGLRLLGRVGVGVALCYRRAEGGPRYRVVAHGDIAAKWVSTSLS